MMCKKRAPFSVLLLEAELEYCEMTLVFVISVEAAGSGQQKDVYSRTTGVEVYPLFRLSANRGQQLQLY